MSKFYIPKDIDVLTIDLTEHDKQVRNKTIDEFKQALKQELNNYDFWHYDIADSDGYTLETNCSRDYLIDEVAEQLKEQKCQTDS